MIQLVTTWDAIVSALGAGAMIAFGVWVLTLTPRTRATKMLAVFAIAAGAVFVPFNLTRWSGVPMYAIWFPYLTAALSVGGLALLGLARGLLEPFDEGARKLWRAAIGLTAVLVAVPMAAGALPISSFWSGLTGWRLLTAVSFDVGGKLFFGAFLALPLVLAWRYRHPPPDRAESTRTQAVLVSAALVIWPAFYTGDVVAGLASPPLAGTLAVWAILSFAGFLALAGLWLANAHVVPERSGEGRNMGLLVAGALLSGMLQRAFVEPHFAYPAEGPIWGLVRLLAVVVLGWAILRHQVLGIDAKFRWGVSKTTVAGVFVAVFFIVSEGAQVLFADVVGSQFLGIIAAGALLFALAPIQKAADRIAEKAVPGGEPAGTGTAQDADPARAEELYRYACEKAYADGQVDREEEMDLAELADRLGVSGRRATEIRREIEDEMTSGGGS